MTEKIHPKHGLTRTLRVAIPTLPHDVTPDFEKDAKKHWPVTHLQTVANAKIYKVEVPIKDADVFATYINSNWGKVL